MYETYDQFIGRLEEACHGIPDVWDLSAFDKELICTRPSVYEPHELLIFDKEKGRTGGELIVSFIRLPEGEGERAYEMMHMEFWAEGAEEPDQTDGVRRWETVELVFNYWVDQGDIDRLLDVY